MSETVNETNALYHCKELHKLLLNAMCFSAFSGVSKTRWTVAEMGQVFDAAWGRGNWRYGTFDIIRIMKTLQDMGLVQIETGLFGRIKAYSLTDTSVMTMAQASDDEESPTDQSIPAGQLKYTKYIDDVVSRAQEAGAEDFIFGSFAIATYEGAIAAMLKKKPGRDTGEKVARELITAGGKPQCVLTALANAFAGNTSKGSHAIASNELHATKTASSRSPPAFLWSTNAARRAR